MSRYYENPDIESLEMYQRLIQYWTILFDKRRDLSVLDNMNFRRGLYPEVLAVSQVMDLHEFEPGYTSPDGSTELGTLIRGLELARLNRAAGERCAHNVRLVASAGLGCGNGTSNVMSAILRAIIASPGHSLARSSAPQIVVILPSYSVYAAQVSQLGPRAEARFVRASQDRGFLPTFQEISSVVTERTVAIVLTYPSNPAQTTYDDTNVEELRRIVEFCQRERIFLIVDNIYQDLLHGGRRAHREIFALTDRTDFVIKIYGHSKDMPFFAGYRTGYWFGDRRIQDAYRYQISANENSMATLSLGLFGVSLLVRTLLITRRELTVEDLAPFQDGLFGWGQTVDVRQLFDRIQSTQLIWLYATRLERANALQAEAVRAVREFVDGSRCFSHIVNDNIGNLCLLHVNPRYFSGNDHDFFKHALALEVGVLPGNVFGIPSLRDDVWFRMTLIHDTAENLVRALARLDDRLAHSC